MSAILVLGTGRCGSSAVAGALHHLGVWMGGRFVDPEDYPVYEDAEMIEAVEQVIDAYERDRQLHSDPFEALMVERRKRPVWGFKYPRLIWALDCLLASLGPASACADRCAGRDDDVKIVLVSRNWRNVVASCRRSYGLSQQGADVWYDQVAGEIELFVEERWTGPILQVRYEDLLEDPRGGIVRLAEFVGGQITPAWADRERQIETAIASIHRPEEV